MKLAVLSRHRRLLALCACSAAIHLALLAWFSGRGGGAPDTPPASADRLVLRLAAKPAKAPVPAAPAAAATRPPRRAAATPDPVRAVAIAAATGIVVAPAGSSLAAPESDAPEAPSPSLPGRYRVRLPASVQLTYTGADAAAAARLEWRTDGRHYSLRIDGVTGTMASEGERGDTGLLPGAASTAGDAGTPLGTQDRASMLLQLAGIGLASPDQLAGTIVLVVAEGEEIVLVRWQVIGPERIETGIGALETRHLAEVAAPGQPRLEVWLAPKRDWLPVQLRLIQPDGSSATQTLGTLTPLDRKS